MIDFDFNEYCCGCTACKSICPVDAIEMKQNSEGFLMPNVIEDKCINCDKCEKACPYLNTSIDIKNFSLKDFAGKQAYLYYSTKKERINSASGGFVNDVNLKTINDGGWVCGCVWDEEINAVHILTNDYSDIAKMQSSKYVQSDMKNCFAEVRERLKNGDKVAFGGTPCQTAGLKQYLGKLSESENLLSICLICHGVPSPKAWDYAKKSLENKCKSKLSSVNMRDKSYKGYSLSYAKYVFRDSSGKKQRSIELARPAYISDPYIYLFTDDLFLRNSCYHCSYKSNNTGADIIVGDFHASTEGAGNAGCSCLVVLTHKGENAISQLDGVKKESTIHEVGSVNGMICHSVPKNPKRGEFFEKLNSNSIKYNMSLLKTYLPIRFYVKNVLGRMGVYNFVRKILK